MRHSCLALAALVIGVGLIPMSVSTPAAAQRWTNGDCTVSIWWPYVRERGDCLTDGEREAGMTGNYQDPEGTYRVPGVESRDTGEELNEEGQPLLTRDAEGNIAVNNERGCTTSILWPYVRKLGDCLTDGEREAGMTGVYGASRMPGDPALPSSVNLAPLPASSGGDGGLFGLFGSEPNYGGGGLLEDNLLPAEQRNP
jgi:hypothetical protein